MHLFYPIILFVSFVEFRSDKMANSDKANQEVSASFEDFFVGKGDKRKMKFFRVFLQVPNYKRIVMQHRELRAMKEMLMSRYDNAINSF